MSVETWHDGHDMAKHATEVTQPRRGYAVLMFPDASDELFEGSNFMKALQDEVDRGNAVEDMNHELLRFLGGVFRDLPGR